MRAHEPRLRSSVPLALALLPLMVVGCTTPPEQVTDLQGTVIAAEPLLVAPGPRWESSEGSWSFRNRAELVVCRRGGDEAIELHLDPDETTRGHGLELRRGGAPLWSGVAAEAAETGDALVLEVEPAVAGRSCERWELVRRYDLDRAPGKLRPENAFARILVRSADAEVQLDPAMAERTEPVQRLVRSGVLGWDQEGRSGTLLLGPGRVRAEVGDGKLRIEPENRSTTTATFRAEGREAVELRLEPGTRGMLEVPVDGEVVLSVEGSKQGLFFWGDPRVLAEKRERGARLKAVVLVTLDTTRRDALSPWEGDPEVTPFLEELARESVVFDDAWTSSPWTLPSHASMLTGLWPSRHGAGVSETALPEAIPTLAERFRDAGWRTLGFAGGELCSSRFGLARGFERWRDPDEFETRGDRLLAYLETALDEVADEGAPVLLFANFFDPHALWQAPPLYQERLGVAPLAAALQEQEGWAELAGGSVEAWRRAIEGEIEITPEARAWMKAAYLAEIAFVDDLLRALVAKLEALGWWDRTLLVLTSDHGELLGEHGFVSHGVRLDPELVAAPLLMRIPGEPGRRDPRLASSVDVFPTLLAAAGLEAPPSDGRSLLGGADGEHPWVLSEEHESLVHPLNEHQKIAAHLYALQRRGLRHLAWESGDRCGERRGELVGGVWADVECEVPPGEVLAALEETLGEIGDASAPVGEPSGALAESLQALGYM